MVIYVDGENFRHGVAEVLASENIIRTSRQLMGFPIRKLLEDVLAASELEIRYYASRIKLPKGFQPNPEVITRAEEIKEYNRSWVAQLTMQNVTFIKAGYLKVKTGEPCPKCQYTSQVLQEKGVDVRLAVDMISDSINKKRGKVNKVFLFSSDSDLIPAIDRARQAGTYVIYVCFSDAVNRAVSASANETITVPKVKVMQHYQEK